MGFMKAMKAANNAWAMVSCDKGLGYLGPEKFIDNRSHKLVIAIGTSVITFEKADVKSIDMICATSEWIKYAIVLKNGGRYIATFMATTVSNKGKTISTSLLNFEWWMADLLYKEKPVQVLTPTALPTVSAPTSSSAQSKQVKTSASTSVKAPSAQATDKNTTPVKKRAVKTKANEQEADSSDKENTYLFALQMLNVRSYNIAYNALSKIKGYKDSDELLKEIEDKI